MDNCLFCKIVNREIPSDMVFESKSILAFNDINPQAPHHILIIPRKHISTLNDIDKYDIQLLGEIHLIVKKIASDRGVADSGYRTVFNCNSDAGQTVFHIHLHLLGGRKMSWPPG